VRMADIAGAERLLRHPVAVLLVAAEGSVTVAASIGGDPPCTRLAWIDWRAGAIVARIACPPARPSRLRPLVATDVGVEQAGVDDRVLAIRVTSGVAGVQVTVADSEQPPRVGIGAERVALVRLPRDLAVVMVDALDAGGEPLGRLDAAGIGVLHLTSGRLAGRLGARHGMAAGFGAGRWTHDLADAAFEAGFAPRLPTWLPDGLERGPFHLEPDAAYPAAPPAVAVAWGREPRRVLVRQTPGPLPNPDTPGGRTEPVAIGAAEGLAMARGRFATLVWEADERAFGVQVVGFEEPLQIALRVASSL
jgi:hypothetical protein